MIQIVDQKIWDTFVENNKSGYLFHKWDFLKIIEKHSGYSLLSYAFYDKEEIIGLLPLFCQKKFFVKLLFSPPPKSAIQYMGIILSDKFYQLRQGKKEEKLNNIINELENEFKKMHFNYIYITFTPDFIDVRNFKWSKYELNIGYTYIINLNNSLDTIYNNFSRSCKEKIKESQNKYKISVEETNDSKIIFDMLTNRYNEQELNIPIYSNEYISDLLIKFPNEIKLIIFKNNDKAITAQVNLIYKDTYLTWIGGIKSNIEINEYARWYEIQNAKTNNFKKFDFSGAGEKHIAQFKNKFNPTLVPIFSVKKTDTIGKLLEIIYFKILKKKR